MWQTMVSRNHEPGRVLSCSVEIHSIHHARMSGMLRSCAVDRFLERCRKQHRGRGVYKKEQETHLGICTAFHLFSLPFNLFA
jgi:hypothetical protein